MTHVLYAICYLVLLAEGIIALYAAQAEPYGVLGGWPNLWRQLRYTADRPVLPSAVVIERRP